MKEIQNIKLPEIEKEIEENGTESEVLRSYKRERLLAVLRKANISADDDQELIDIYEAALEVSDRGWTIFHSRDVDEIYVNNYNREWILSWNANMDIQLCLDFFAIITYISYNWILYN